MDTPRAVEIAYRQRQIQNMASKLEHMDTAKSKSDLWARAARLFRKGTDQKEDTQ